MSIVTIEKNRYPVDTKECYAEYRKKQEFEKVIYIIKKELIVIVKKS